MLVYRAIRYYVIWCGTSRNYLRERKRLSGSGAPELIPFSSRGGGEAIDRLHPLAQERRLRIGDAQQVRYGFAVLLAQPGVGLVQARRAVFAVVRIARHEVHQSAVQQNPAKLLRSPPEVPDQALRRHLHADSAGDPLGD